MKEKNKSILIALSFIVALILFVWGFNFLKGKSLIRNQLTLYAIYDNSLGLLAGDLVTINGMAVGNISALNFHPSHDGRIVVRFTVNNDIQIPKNSVAKLASHLTGSVNINIELGDSHIPSQNGDTLTSGYDSGTMGMITEQILPLKDKIEALIVSVNTLSDNINNMLNTELKNNINEGVDAFASSMNNINHITSDLKQIVDSNDEKLNSIIGNLEGISNDFSAISDSLSKINYTRLISSLENCITDFSMLIEGLNNAEGSAGLLLKDEKLYNNLNETINTLHQLLDEIKKDPKKLKISVF